MNLYTSSVTEIGSLRNVGPATAKRIVDLRHKVFAQEHQPLSPEVLGALPGVRLNAQEWQALLEDGIISLQMPEAPPVRAPDYDSDTDTKQQTRDESQKVTVAQMENFGKNLWTKINKEMKNYIKEMSQNITGDITDLKMSIDACTNDLDKRLTENVNEGRERSAEYKSQLKETQEALNYVVGRLPPAYSDTGKSGNGSYVLPTFRSLETEDKMPFTLDFTGDRNKWLSEDESLIRKLSKPIPSDGIYVKRDPDRIQTGSQSSQQKNEDNEEKAPKHRVKNKKIRERGRSRERTRARHRTSPKRRESSSRERAVTRRKYSPPPYYSDSSDDESSSTEDSDRSLSPMRPKMEVFRGDSKGPTWLSFITKFHRTAKRRGWSKRKRLERLFDCLAETALEYATKSKGRHSYKDLKKELGLRFDLREAPVAARQNLYLMKQSDDESLEAYLQRVLTAAMHGLKTSDNGTVQLLATEAFLRGCRHKEAAALVFNEAPQNIQEACQKIKTVLANRKAIFGTKVSFQEKAFTLQEENRVSGIEKKVDSLTEMITRYSQSPYRDNRDRSRYSSPPYRDTRDSGQFSPRQQSPSYDRGGPPRNFGGGRFGDGDYRGRSPTRTYRDRPQQGQYNQYSRYRSPSPQRREQYQYGPSNPSYGGQYAAPQQGPFNRERSPQSYRPQSSGGQYSGISQQGQFNSDRSQQQYRPQSPGGQYNMPQQGQFSNRPPNQNYSQYRQRSVDLPDQAVNLTTDRTPSQILSPDHTANQDLNFQGLVVPATNH